MNKEQRPETPKTWSELVYQNKEIPCLVEIDEVAVTTAKSPIEKSALALLKIHQLIEAGYGGNVTNNEWKNRSIIKWKIGFDIDGDVMIDYCAAPIAYTPIAFHTEEQAEEFLNYPENVQLLTDCFML